MVDEQQLKQDLNYIDIGQKEGAELAWGAKLLNREDREATIFEPVLFVNTKNEMRINREEIFGPVASVIKVNNYDEALATANDTHSVCHQGFSPAHSNMPGTFEGIPPPAW